MAEHASRVDEIDDAVRTATSHWSKAGVPRSTRRRKADELRDHLNAAVADGRSVRDVVGSDVVSFAAEWAQADRQRTWVEPVLFLLSHLTLWLGLLALLGPIVEVRDSFGMPGDLAATIEVAIVCLFAIWLIRWFRAQVTKRVAIVLYGLIAAAYAVSILVVIPDIDQLDRFVEMSPLTVVALITIGLSSLALSTWLKRTNRM